ncbi:hypothetical protein [Runella limosa]|uniref:hypothetical protein n=1 Tax=Runella limosa TaxID=370978 RepID=UPI00042A8AAB|nr:hypothetical protein [Runella limosa]
MELEGEVRRMSRKVATLEDILSDYIVITERDNRQLRADIRAIGDRMEADTAKLKAEMSEFKNGMSEFKNEMRASTKDLHKKMGDLSRKLGTFVEDFAAPNLPRIAAEYFNEPNLVNHLVRWTRYNPANRADSFEADAVTETENMVFFLEAKFSPRNDDINELPARIEEFKKRFPEFKGKNLVTIFASWSISENHLRMLTKMGVYALVMGEETMELANFDALK